MLLAKANSGLVNNHVAYYAGRIIHDGVSVLLRLALAICAV